MARHQFHWRRTGLTYSTPRHCGLSLKLCFRFVNPKQTRLSLHSTLITSATFWFAVCTTKPVCCLRSVRGFRVSDGPKDIGSIELPQGPFCRFCEDTENSAWGSNCDYLPANPRAAKPRRSSCCGLLPLRHGGVRQVLLVQNRVLWP